MTAFVEQLSVVEREKLYGLGQPVSYGAGEVLMWEGQPGDYVLLIETGDVQVFKIQFDGRKNVLNSCRSGDLVGEFACFAEKGVRSASVVAQGAVAAVKIARNAFLDFLDEHPALWRGIAERMIDRIVEKEGRPDNKSIRVLAAVADQAERHARGRGALIPLSQEKIAGVAHVSGVTAYRVLADLKKWGLASSRRGKVEVRCVPCLRAAAVEALSTQIYGQIIIGCGGADDCPRR